MDYKYYVFLRECKRKRKDKRRWHGEQIFSRTINKLFSHTPSFMVGWQADEMQVDFNFYSLLSM